MPDNDYPHPLGLHVTKNREREAKASFAAPAGLVSKCETCKQFGQLKGVRGIVRGTVCLAPCDEGYRFVYEASPNGCCELWTPKKKGQA